MLDLQAFDGPILSFAQRDRRPGRCVMTIKGVHGYLARKVSCRVMEPIASSGRGEELAGRPVLVRPWAHGSEQGVAELCVRSSCVPMLCWGGTMASEGMKVEMPSAVAELYDLPGTGTIGLLIRAKKESLIDLLRHELDKLIHQSGFRTAQPRFRRALDVAGE